MILAHQIPLGHLLFGKLHKHLACLQDFYHTSRLNCWHSGGNLRLILDLKVGSSYIFFASFLSHTGQILDATLKEVTTSQFHSSVTMILRFDSI